MRAYGPQGWWPGHSRFEVVVGAILTQGVAWTNVEKAIRNLKVAGLLRLEAMRRAGARRLSRLIRSAGYFNQKARRLPPSWTCSTRPIGVASTTCFAAA